MVKAKKLLFFSAIKKQCSENKSNSFLQENHLLFYDQGNKILIRLIGGLLADWPFGLLLCLLVVVIKV